MSAPLSPDSRGSPARVVVIATRAAEPVAQIVRRLPEHSGLTLVMHHDGEPDGALQPTSAFPITEARGRIRLEPNRLFVIPAGWEAAFQRDELVVMQPQSDAPRAPVDKLLRSLADEHGGQGIAVILESRGTDGVIGVRRLQEAGGLTIAQARAADSIEPPQATAEIADLVLPLSEIGERLVVLGRQPPGDDADGGAESPDEAASTGRRASSGLADTLQEILVLLRVRSGHDFGSYKRATLYRRVSRRMQVCQCASIAAYHQYLREHTGEVAYLLRDFLISVTNFFRDRSAFDALAGAVIPRLFLGKTPADQVRVWVAGCATGEEAYSIAILLYEYARTLDVAPQLQIFATDIDEEALAEARIGRYPSTIGIDVSADRLQRFFARDGDHYRVNKELREILLFSPHNVLRDPPFSRLDLISCRNLLIYLNREAQDRVLNVFHFGLRPDSLLFLGSSESAENTTMFASFDAKHRLFVRRPTTSRLGSDSIITTGRWDRPNLPAPVPLPPAERPAVGQLHHQLVERLAPPSVLVDEELDLLHVSEHAGQLLHVAGGEPSRQLLRLIHPALRLDLRTAIYAARQSGRGSDTRVVRFDDGGRPRAIELRVRAVRQPELSPGTLLILFDELDPSPSADAPGVASDLALEPVMHELEEELRRTRDQLRTTIEQYETSLEELKASNEELQAINEELRSATEELETSKEELQSVNEELTTLNHELKRKVDEISHTNSDLQNLMTSTDLGVVFLDRALNIKRFTPRVQDLINVIPSDVGRPLAHLTHRLQTDDLPALAQSVLDTLRTVEREVQSRDGRRYLARMLPYRSLEDRIDGVVLTFVEVSDLRDAVDARQRSEAALLASEERLRFALRTAPMLVVSLDDQLHATWGYLLGKELELREPGAPSFLQLLAPQTADRFTAIARQVLRDRAGQRAELDLTIQGEVRTYDFRIERDELGVNAVGFDITPSKLAEVALRDADRRKDEFLATLSHELRNPLTPLKVALDVAKLAGGDPPQLERSLGIMDRQVAQLAQLVDELLDLSRITQGKIEIERTAVDPVRVVEAALEATRPLFQQRDQKIEIELPVPSCRVLGDQGRLTQVLINLMTNAAKYTPRGGHIELALVVDRTRDVLAIRVRDDGDGITPELLPQIFEIFVQSRDAGGRSLGGLGVGLNLVRRLVELHGGSVSATSAGPGQGSEFVVELPLVTGRVTSRDDRR
jgi:two-component system, chemotaxis family, CheB/CheR fusion protein